VYQAEDIQLGRFVALKFPPDILAKDPHALSRFDRDANGANVITLSTSESSPFLTADSSTLALDNNSMIS
jgi:hypothetical protein